ncbi:hypothetical protein A3A74_03850 [Candidatus Roizmanbacteria bacterium RIFCSPLOWO2_01_FULL_35_13]|uniref:Uncharacterized protein n=1 Tax=Candidatus Roizmanbacteria bacterium RIFCSPLOWO2_01_FULL_35_13 TaxID=1802055 RepID=A0A1F7IBI6_9BACT|nr:MAG: hypothetical protein A3A74_03850 [Candidatus Roizmanbacteria bacterium RIFCSPLOWO2_01_FULL_35_13]
MISSCICDNGKKSYFRKFISYKNETVFKEFEGIVIGKCENCGILKTFPPESGVKFNPKQSRAEFYDNSQEKFIGLFKPIVNLIKKHKKSGTILDVGCSSGILLTLLKKEEFNIKGIEPNKKAFSIAKNKLGKDIFSGTLQDFLGRNKKKFDCIIYNHVLEHIEDPVEEINLAKKILKRGGILILGVPNTSNIIFYLRQKYWEPLMPNEHIWHFNTKYLISLFKRLDLKVIEKYFSDDGRQDYPLMKKSYFRTLSFVNKFFGTGEAVLLVFKPI